MFILNTIFVFRAVRRQSDSERLQVASLRGGIKTKEIGILQLLYIFLQL